MTRHTESRSSRARSARPRLSHLSVSLVLAIVFLSTGFILWNTYTSTADEAQRVRADAEQLVDTLASSLEVPLWDLDRRNMYTICSHYLQNELVARIELKGITGEMYFGLSRGAASSEGKTLALTREISSHGELVGFLAVDCLVGREGDLFRRLAQPLTITVMIFVLTVVVLLLMRGRARIAHELAELNQQLEHKVELRTRELERSKDALEQANVSLLEMDKRKSTFLSSVAHELRTPMTSIYGFAKLITNDLDELLPFLEISDPKLKRKQDRLQVNLATIVGEGERLTRLINEVLDITKIESDDMQWNDQPTDMRDLLEHCVDVISGVFMTKDGVSLRSDLAPDLPVLTLDPDRLTQVFLNLLHNAAKFTDQGEVVLAARALDSGGLRASVADTGQGIPLQHLDKVFDRFHRTGPGDIMDEHFKGAGLGLAICRQIVGHYQGAVWAEPNPGGGAKLVVELPGDAERGIGSGA
ncbi:MAG: sensor histidine kinase [Desulfovibrio sp.]|nr:MAG: sensor histidine kinase [Desulfovibrio sp.]